MSKRIVYLDSYSNSNGVHLHNKILDYVMKNKGDCFYYILPSGKLLKKYRKKLIDEIGDVFNINLFTFDDVVSRLLDEDFYIDIDNQMKEVLISKILTMLNGEDRLKYYRKISSKEGFIKILINIIGQLKGSLITSAMYMQRSPNTPFYREIGYIYEEYEKQLDNNGFLDGEGGFIRALSLLAKDNRFFKGLDFIIIDNFFDFRPHEMAILKEMVDTDIAIYINMPFNRKGNFQTLLKTLETLKDLGFEILDTKPNKTSYFEQLANCLFTQDVEPMAPNSNINLIKAPNNYLEMRKVVERIKIHLNRGTSLDEMAVVLGSPKDYKDAMLRVFKEEDIPCSIGRDKRLIELPLIKEILYILELKKSNMEKTSVINRIKSHYFSIYDSEDRDLLEHMLRKLDFDFIYELKDGRSFENFIHRDRISEVIKKMNKETGRFSKRAAIKSYTDIINQIIDEYQIGDFIINIYAKTGDYDLLRRDILALNGLKEVLEKLSRLQGVLKGSIPFQEFLRLLENYLQNESITDAEGSSRGVNILTPVMARGHKFKVLFLIGLSQGKYPNLQGENFFFKEEGYEQLKEIGIDVKNYYERLDKESLIFTTIISACRDTLYLSYSENSTEDEKDIPSIFLDELLRMIDGISIEEKVNVIDVNMDYLLKTDAGQLTRKSDIPKYLIGRYQKGKYKEEHFRMYNEIDASVFNEVNNNIMCQLERYSSEFNQYDGKIGDEYIRRDISSMHKSKTYSVSYLESYGICPYYFLLNNILGVEELERSSLDFTPLDRGIIVHDVLKQYYLKFKGQIKDHILGVEIFDIEDSYGYIIDTMERVMFQMGIGGESKLWEMRIENNAARILNFVRSDLERLSKLKEKVIPIGFEIDFGREEPFSIDLGDVQYSFAGTIDRIDKYVDEEKYILMDYKSSVYGDRDIEDMRSGLSLQLPIYILSQKDKNVVAGIYGIISDGEFRVRIGDVAEKFLITRGNKGALTRFELGDLLDEIKDIIRSYIQSIHDGDFSINPKECSTFCIYRDICRYEKRLEVK